MATYREDTAEDFANRAGLHEGKEKQTDAIGEGLAAVAFALLEVAAAIREASDKDM